MQECRRWCPAPSLPWPRSVGRPTLNSLPQLNEREVAATIFQSSLLTFRLFFVCFLSLLQVLSFSYCGGGGGLSFNSIIFKTKNKRRKLSKTQRTTKITLSLYNNEMSATVIHLSQYFVSKLKFCYKFSNLNWSDWISITMLRTHSTFLMLI